MNDLTSIIVPSHNTARFITETIKSVQAQTCANWEMIVVDDCSTDDTDAVVRPFLSDRRIRYLKNSTNRGAAAARNYALREARGRWIAFLDSDDAWRPEKLEKQIRFMKENDVAFSYTKYEEIDERSKTLGAIVSGPRRITRRGMYRYCWPGCLTVMYDARRVGLVQIADIQKNNDYAMWLQICKKADCYLLNEVLAKYRRGRAGSVSSHSVWTMIGWHYKMFRICDGQCVVCACFSTARNLFYGFYKKLKYVEKIKGR